MSNNMEFDKNSQGPNKGVSGYLENSLAKNRVNRFAFGSGDNQESGFLNEAVKNADALIQKIKEIEKELGGANKVTQSMTKTQEKAYERSKSDAKLLSDTMKEIQRTGSLSQAELNQLIKDNEKVSKDAVKILTNLINSMDKSSTSNIKRQRELIEQTNLVIQKQNEQISKSKQDMKELNQELKDTQDTFTKGLGNTLKNAGNKLGELSNMLNLQSIANNTAEQNARSRVAIMNEVNKQFGFTSNGQFESFKNSLVGTIKDMNNEMDGLFSTNDMKNYMSSLSQYGITNTEIAKEQMKASIIGNKYLGVSAETQEMIFKYMKRTNNNDALNEHNKTIAGLLASNLNVSKEQLDALTQIAYGAEEDLKALGMNQTAFASYERANEVVGASLGIDDNSAKALQELYKDFLTTGPTDTSKWASLVGTDFKSLWEEGFNSTSAQMSANNMLKFYQAVGSSNLLNASNNGDNYTAIEEAVGTGFLNNYSNINSAQITALKSLNFDKINDSINEGFKSINDTNVENYIEQSTEATWLEKIQNKLSTFIDEIPWKLTMGLANVAFSMYIAGGALDMIKGAREFFGGINQNGGLGSIFSKFLGKGSTMAAGAEASVAGAEAAGTGASAASAIAAGTAGIALGVGAAALITKAITDARQSAKDSYTEKNVEQLKNYDEVFGTNLAENDAMINVANSASETSGANNNLFTRFGGAWQEVTHGAWAGIADLFSSNVSNINKREYSLFDDVMKQLGNDKDRLEGMYLAWALLADSAGYLSSAGNGNYTKQNLEDMLKSGKWQFSKDLLDSYADSIVNTWHKGPYKTKNDRQKYIDWSRYNVDGYHKAGLDWVPRDNYKALLHKGEMILNEREANAYRNVFGIGGESDSSNSGTPSPIYTDYPWPMTAGWPRYPSSKKQHRGIDWGIPVNTPVGAAFGGRVVAVEKNNFGKSGYGNYVRILGDNGKYFRYGHLTKPLVEVGQTVTAGTSIGLSGNTGNSTGPHLHYQVDSGSSYTSDINPYPYITNGLFQTNGNIPSNNITSEASNMSAVNTLGARRYIPKSLSTGGIGGPEGVSQITSSVDGGFDRLISYLDSISREQNEQRALLETYSIAKGSEPNY